MDGHEFTIERKGTTQPEHIELIEGEGMPIMGTSRFGDLRVKIHVELPIKLNTTQLDAIKCALTGNGNIDKDCCSPDKTNEL